MNKAYIADLWRSAKKSKKRFFSIMIITALGVTMLTGLKAACIDMRVSADQFYDEQNLFDIRIQSTLGLTDSDVAALSALHGVQAAEGGYSEAVYTQTDGERKTAEVKTLSTKGINLPYLAEGELPQETGEIAVTGQYAVESGKTLGDTINLERKMTEEDSGTSGLVRTEYTIAAVVLDPMNVTNTSDAGAFRSANTTDYTFYITKADADSDVYTAVYLTLSDTKGLVSYSEPYKAAVSQMTDIIENQIKLQREQARYDDVVGEATEQLADEQTEMENQFAEAEAEFADAGQELADGQKELEDSSKELADGRIELENSRKELANGKVELENGSIELEQKEEEAKQKLADARNELANGYAQLAKGEAELEAGQTQLADGQVQLDAGKAELEKQQGEANAQFDAAHGQLEEAKVQLGSTRGQLDTELQGLTSIFAGAWPGDAWNTWMQTEQQDGESAAAAKEAFYFSLSPILEAMTAAIDAQLAVLDPASEDYVTVKAGLDAQRAQLGMVPGALDQLASGMLQVVAGENELAVQEKTLDAKQTEADLQFAAAWEIIAVNKAELEKGRAKLAAGRETLEEGRSQLDAGAAELAKQEQDALSQIENAKSELEKSRQDLADGEKKLADGQKELADGEKKLLDGQNEWTDGQQELTGQRAEYEEEKIDAQQKLADAREKIRDIDMTQWYVQDRSSLDSYASIDSDTASIEAVGTAFPIVFFVVAVLVSLTTITRMVEEERGLIGIYKALGFKDTAIYARYLLYASAACLTGSVLGDLCGFIFFPKFIWVIFEKLYLLPDYTLKFDVWYGVGGAMLFTAGIVGATALTCRGELAGTPAALMRPKAPRAGSRVWLEHLTFLWNRLRFLNKVTLRNLFRYKKRLFMTVSGIMGCTALLMCGFAIKDSVTSLMPKQYGHIYAYDWMAVTDASHNDSLLEEARKDENVADFINLQIGTVKIKNAKGREEKVQLMVMPDTDTPDGYLYLENTDGEKMDWDGNGVLVTQNAAQLLELSAGDTALLQDDALMQAEVPVEGIVNNYLGNNVYMTQRLYEKMFGGYEPNSVLAHLSDSCEDEPAFADEFAGRDHILSSVSITALRRDFEANFTMITAVVSLITAMAAGLALVVLFTLSTTNISERTRELATIKVLGFYDREVHLYVNKETLILTALGIALGLPLGRLLSGGLTYVLLMPSIYFAVYVRPVSYVAAAAVAFCFALLVDTVTNRTLDSIDMVEALKSME